MPREATLDYFDRALPGTLAVAAVGYGLNALIFITMARFLDPANFGSLKVAASAMLVTSLVVGLGGARAAGRFLPPRLAGSRQASAYLRFFAISIGGLSVLVAAVIWAFVLFDPAPLPADIHGHHPISFIVLMVPVWAGLELLSQTYMAIRRPIAGSLPARFVFPAVGLAVIGFAHWQGWYLSAVSFTLVLTVAGLLTIAVFGTHLAVTERARLREPPEADDDADAGPRDWLSLSLPMMGAALLIMLVGETPLFVLSLLGETHAAGLYGAAITLTQSFLIIITCQRQLYGPSLARALAEGPEQARRLHAQSQRQALLFVLPLAIALIVGGDWLLGLFGPGFAEERTILVILVAGLSVQALTGLAARWLDYGGHARAVTATEAGTLIGVAAGSLILVPLVGPVGAAVAFAIATAAKSVILVVLAQRRLGLPVFALARPR